MAELPTYEEMGKKVFEEAIDGYIYKGKTLREWINILAQTQWIPVSSGRLPEEGETVLTIDLYGVYAINRIIDVSPNVWLYDGVVAWMPLPEPYEESEEVK